MRPALTSLLLLIASTLIVGCATAPHPPGGDPTQAMTTPPEASRPDPDPAPTAAPPAATPEAATAPAAEPAPSRTEIEPFLLLDEPDSRGARDLVIVAVGDVSQPAEQWVEATESLEGKAFDPTRELLQSGDLTFMNLENPMTSLKPNAKKKYAFTSPPQRLEWYFDAGFNMFSLANNHIADADQPGIDDTIRNLEQTAEARGVPAYHAGAGATPEEGISPRYFTPEGKELTVAFFSVGFSRSENVGRFWDESLPERIREAKERADLVIVSTHAGKEYLHVPEEAFKTRYRSWVDAGADLVIGHHPHCIRPVENYRGALILHSLGNFVFASRTVRHRSMDAKLYGMLARIVIEDGELHGAQLVPLWVNNSEDWVLDDGQTLPNANFVPQILTGVWADAWFEDMARWSEAAGFAPLERVGDTGFIRVTPEAGEPVSMRPRL